MTDIAVEQAMIVSAGANQSSPGRTLSAAREARGLTVAQIAESLRFKPRQIEALENDDYAMLPGATVVRGMVRNYSRLVGLDAEPLLAQLRDRLTSKQGPLSIGTHIPMRQSNPRSTMFYVALSAVVGLIGIAVAIDSVFDTRSWFKGERMEPVPARNPEGAGAPPVISAPAITGDPAPPDDASATPAPAVASDPAPLPEGVRRLRFKFDRESWVEVRGANGTSLHNGLNAAGTERIVEGRPPFVIVIGAAAGVQLTDDDRPVDLARHTKIDVARFTLE